MIEASNFRAVCVLKYRVCLELIVARFIYKYMYVHTYDPLDTISSKFGTMSTT
jgi:hypothetical protein